MRKMSALPSHLFMRFSTDQPPLECSTDCLFKASSHSFAGVVCCDIIFLLDSQCINEILTHMISFGSWINGRGSNNYIQILIRARRQNHESLALTMSNTSSCPFSFPSVWPDELKWQIIAIPLRRAFKKTLFGRIGWAKRASDETHLLCCVLNTLELNDDEERQRSRTISGL